MAAAFVLLPLKSFSQQVPEYDLKAAFVYNFALFTEWPANTSFESGSLNVCINPSSAMREPLTRLNMRMVKGRKIVIRPVTAIDSLRACHVLFVDAGDRERWPQIRKAVANASVLTVADDTDIGHDGSVISLAMEGNRIVFDIDTRAAASAKLVLSSKLLRLARTVP